MRFKTLILVVFALLIVASLPVMSTTATPNRYPAQATGATQTCNDPKLIGQIGTDLSPIFDQLKTIPSTGAGGVYTIMINIANTRQKYEDMDTPTDAACNYLVTQTIIYLATVGDYGLVEMGDKLGLDKATIDANRQTISARLDKQGQALLGLIAGTSATPAG